MLLTRRAVSILTYRASRGGRWELDTRGLFDTRCRVTTANVRFRGFVVRSEEDYRIPFVVIRADTAEERDAVLWTQFLNQTPSINAFSPRCAGKNKPWDSLSSLSTTGARAVFRHRVDWRGPSVSTASESRRGGVRLFPEWEVQCLLRCET